MNTIIECVVRNTPIIVNNHPAVVEILGKKYPLYFNNGSSYFDMNTQINGFLTIANINNANIYLQKMDKSKLNITNFIDNFSDQIKLLSASALASASV